MKHVFSNLDKAKVRMLDKSPFFSVLLMGTQMIPTDAIPTAATDGLRIIYNPEFMAGLSVEVTQFVLAHELGHMMYEHISRKGARNHKLYNIAGDYVINLLLKDDGFELWPNALVDEQYRGMTTEQVYRMLEDNPPPEECEPDFGGDLQAPGQPCEGQPGAERIQQEIRQRVAQAASAARLAGKLSAGLEALVSEVLNPKVRWQDLLRDYMTRSTKDDEAWGRRNRRFQGVYLPARYSERMGEIVIIGDTSGSIGQDELNQVAAEVNAIAETVRPEAIRVIWADAKVCGEQVFEVGEEIRFEPAGGGGTDMRVPLEYVRQYNPEVVILATDGYTPWPDIEPEYPLIVCCSTTADVPIGQVVRL
jgi:predicted metal-dependent peptidase